MKMVGVTIFKCDRCGYEEKIKYGVTSLNPDYIPDKWSVDESNDKHLCEKCTILRERLRQAFYNPKTFRFCERDYGMEIFERTKKVDEEESNDICD